MIFTGKVLLADISIQLFTDTENNKTKSFLLLFSSDMPTNEDSLLFRFRGVKETSWLEVHFSPHNVSHECNTLISLIPNTSLLLKKIFHTSILKISVSRSTKEIGVNFKRKTQVS